MFKRYAIYYTPRPGDFAQRGAAWLGWDLQAGIPVEHPAIDDLDIAKLTDRPRKYGLHGTVKAPFELTKASTEAQLAEGVATFCKGQAPVQLDGLALSQIGRFWRWCRRGIPPRLAVLRPRPMSCWMRSVPLCPRQSLPARTRPTSPTSSGFTLKTTDTRILWSISGFTSPLRARLRPIKLRPSKRLCSTI